MEYIGKEVGPQHKKSSDKLLNGNNLINIGIIEWIMTLIFD